MNSKISVIRTILPEILSIMIKNPFCVIVIIVFPIIVGLIDELIFCFHLIVPEFTSIE